MGEKKDFGLIISLNYSPGLKKELVSLGKFLSQKGFNIKYIVNERYKLNNIDEKEYLRVDTKTLHQNYIYLLPFGGSSNWKQIEELEGSCKLVIFYNTHPLNISLAKKLSTKCNNICKFVHEPYKQKKIEYGLFGAAKHILAESIQSKVIKQCKHVFLPSIIAMERYNSRFGHKDVYKHNVRLVLPDTENKKKNRKYVSIIGNVNSATGHDLFLDTARHAEKIGFDIPFSIVTSSTKYRKKWSSKIGDNVKCFFEKQLSDQKIDKVVSKSIATMKLDREITQSGVVPVSFRKGTPLIARNIPGLVQHVDHKENGFILSENPDKEEIISSIKYVDENRKRLSSNARKKFVEKWSPKAYPEYYDNFIRLVS